MSEEDDEKICTSESLEIRLSEEDLESGEM